MSDVVIRIGSRKKKLALTQAGIFKQAFLKQHQNISSDDLPILPFDTSGDQHPNERLADIGGKGLFTKELDQALIDEQIDVAVHSLKDMETHLHPEITIACVLERADARDVFLSKNNLPLKDMPAGSIIGTASLRRQSLLLSKRPDLKVELIRGTVPTRIQKVRSGPYDGTFLAYAGLQRLDMLSAATEILDPQSFVPAAGQGTLAVCIKKSRTDLLKYLEPLSHRESLLASQAERAVLAEIDGSCYTPIGAYATIQKGTISLLGFLGSENGAQAVRHQEEGSDPIALGHAVGRKLKELFG